MLRFLVLTYESEVIMKIPSVQRIFQDSIRTFLRFPFVLINAALGTTAAVMLIDHEGPAQATVLFNILLASILGIPLLSGFALFAEKKKWGTGMAIGLQMFGIFLLVGYGCLVPSDLSNAPAIHIFRLILIAVALNLFVAFAPFSGHGEINGFWHYNKILLLRLIITAVYTVVLFAGLALALAALDNLFGMDVPGKRYAQLWFTILGVFNTWSLLAGIPENLEQLEGSTGYPKGIKIFAQYILIPLVLIYLVILYAYMAKILISWDWPQGWVGRLILGFSTTGIFSLLLLYPIRKQDENIWIEKAARWLYFLMVPLVIMLLLALWRRISEYGITENRYIAIGLGIWLGIIVVYFVLSRTKNIKIIPVSLCILALLFSFGPWSVFSVSENSQADRLQDLLTTNNILVDNRIQKAPQTVPQDDVRQISSIIVYLHDIHGYERIQPWFQESLKDSPGETLKIKDPGLVTEMMGIEYINVQYTTAGDEIIFRSNQSDLIDIQGYDRMIRGQYFDIDQDYEVLPNQEILYRVNSTLDAITFTITAHEAESDSLYIDFHPWFNQLLADYGDLSVRNIPPGKMMIWTENQDLKVKIYFRYIRLRREGNLVKPENYQVDILYKIERERF
jgi:hypothetical protein